MNPRKNWLEQRRSKPETPPQEADKAAPQADKAAPQAPGNALRGGSYSVALTAVVLAILIAANFFVPALPSSMTTYDISASKLYSVTSNTKAVAGALEEDVNIYWIVQSGEEDDVLENLLSRYAALSDHITVETRNPDEYPTFAAQYTDETVENNSLVVTCGERSRYIAFDEIYVEETSAYSYSYSTSFDGEGAITSAIDYVTSDDLPKLYLLEGHGEAELPATFAEQIEKENIETESLSLLNVDEIPEDADALLIYAPASDISEEEADLLAAYVEAGGKLLAVAGPTEDGLPENLYSLLSIYGVSAQEGIVIEGNRGYYAFQSPYVLLPDMADADITASLIEENYMPILPLAAGLTSTGGTTQATVTELLTTSDEAFSKVAGYDLTTYEKEDGDIDGPFALAVQVEINDGGEIIWFSSSSFLEDMYNAYSSGANGDLAMNALSALIGEREALAIRSKSLNYNFLTISESTASLLKTVMIGICPLGCLGIGILAVLRRRRNQNAPV